MSARNVLRIRCVALMAAFLTLTVVANAQPAAGQSDRDAHMQWWRDARFGMFIHWGLYSIPAGEWNGKVYPGPSEWLIHYAHIPPADYEPLAAQFNPVEFDAHKWVEVARNAGMKYLVITSKHHDGFCMWPSKYTDYDIMDATPFKRDVLRELADECRKQGIRFGLYHSIMDWHQPDYLPREPGDPRPASDADFDRYDQTLKNQVAELIESYHPAVLWFDGQWQDTWTRERGLDLFKFVRSLDPDVIVNNRVGKPGPDAGETVGDFDTPEQQIPGTGLPGIDWETCMTMNDSWGFKRSDHNWKSSPDLIRMLIDIASKGGNLLLNVGPTSAGEIPPESVERLEAMGRWLEDNGDAIYGTTASPFRHMMFDGRCTVRGNRLYLHVLEWPADRTLKLPGLRNKVKFAQFLEYCRSDQVAADVKSFAIDRDGETVTIHLPNEPLDPIATVVVAELDGPPDVDPTWIVKPDADGSIRLTANVADVHGMTARYQTNNGIGNIGYWTTEKDWVSWKLQVDRAGEYEVYITQATQPGTGGAEFKVTIGGQSVTGQVWETGSWTKFETKKLGEVKLSTGEQELAVKIEKKPGFAVMNLHKIELRPVAKE